DRRGSAGRGHTRSEGHRSLSGHRRRSGAPAARCAGRTGRREGLMLEIKNLSAGYGSFQALFDVSLSVKAGESIAVIGPNGAGKTTLLRATSRLIDATSGEMAMEGRRYNDIPSHEVVSLGIAQVPEGRRLFP